MGLFDLLSFFLSFFLFRGGGRTECFEWFSRYHCFVDLKFGGSALLE